MSLSTDRQAIADAVSLVDGVQGKPYRPMTFTTGDAWPLIVGPLDRATGENFLVTWKVTVVLPSDERKAEQWFTENALAIANALEAFTGYVTQITPGSIDTEAGERRSCMILLYENEGA